MSKQFSLFDPDSKRSPYRPSLMVRPANMRTTHGIREDDFVGHSCSVSAVQCVEETLVDAQFVRLSGGGMDAPEDMPTGSLKAIFWTESDGVSSYERLTGVCQRTTRRK